MLLSSVKKDGRILEKPRVIGLAVEKAHKLGRAKGWGSVVPSLLATVPVSGNVQVLRQECCFYLLKYELRLVFFAGFEVARGDLFQLA